MEIRNAEAADFDVVFDYIEKLWTYNTYDKTVIKEVYDRVLANPNDFAYLLYDGGKAVGFCHGKFFDTFWLSGTTCYVSSIISDPNARKKGYGRALMDHAQILAKERHCHAIVLDSGMPRTDAHGFYEHYGFDKSAFCFELELEY